MKNNLFTFAAAAAFAASTLLASCSDPEPTLPPTEEEPKERFPCEGPWCFDIENNPLAKEAWDKFQPRMEPWIFETIAESYAACSYTETQPGLVVVRCPDWAVELGTPKCPQHWFEIGGSAGQVYAHEGQDAFIYCFMNSAEAVSSGTRFFCSNGQVNPGNAANTIEDITSGRLGANACMLPEDCALLEELQWPSKEKSCFYSDFSHISAGAPEEVDCATLAEGECAINCACPAQPPELAGLFGSRCHHLSPDRPVGVCGYTSCDNDEACTEADLFDGACLHRTELPEWAQEYQEAREERLGYSVRWGACVETAHFNNWRGRDDAGFKYGD